MTGQELSLRARVLVVDDDEIVLEFIKTTLEMAGYEVLTATDGAQAWEAVRQGRVRLVVTDWEMPSMSGLDLCRRIRAAELPDYVYIVLVTGHNSIEDIVNGLSAGADDFVTKPLHPQELIVRLKAGERIFSLESRDVTIFALAKLVESRDPETGEHIDRIQAYCDILVRWLAGRPQFAAILTDAFMHYLRITSPLHDIGKVGIPDTILLKPGRLNDEEFRIMKTHASIGGKTLGAALERYPHTRYLRMARDIAMFHHERCDGTGYPQGLKGDQIPFSARIVALADIYDALTTKRVYKEASSHFVARQIIEDNKGNHLDPDVTDAFLACENLFLRVSTGEEKPAEPGKAQS